MATIMTDIKSSYNEQRQKDDLDRQIHDKTDDDTEGDSHYCDVMIGGSQSVIGNLINNLHKILHDTIYQGSIVVDKLGIKQIDYDIYAPPVIEFNQDHVDNVIMNITTPVQITLISKVSSRLNVKIKGQILTSVYVAISADNKLIVDITDSKVSIISSSLGPGTQPLINRIVSSIRPIINSLVHGIFSSISIPNISFSSNISFNPIQISNINKYFLSYTTLSTGSNSNIPLPSASSASSSTDLPIDKLFIIFHNNVINAIAATYLEEKPIYSGENSINTLTGILSYSYIMNARNINIKPVGRNRLSVSANATINGSLKYRFISSPYSATADLGIDASLSVDPSSGNLRVHFAVTSISNINTKSFGFSNIILDTISNNLSHYIIKLLPQYDISIFTIPTKMHIGLPVTMTLSNIEYNEFDKYNGIIITADASFQK
jgi:hypothetical protein